MASGAVSSSRMPVPARQDEAMTMASPAARPGSYRRRRLRRRSFPGAPRRVRGRPSGLQGAAHRAGARQPCGLPWTPETAAAPGRRNSGQAQACPANARRAQPRSGGRTQAPERKETDEPASGTQKAENDNYHSQALESVKHHPRPNRQRSAEPRHKPHWPFDADAPRTLSVYQMLRSLDLGRFSLLSLTRTR